MAGIQYQLIAQNEKDGSVETVWLDPSDMFSAFDSQFVRDYSLEQIDLFTMQFIHQEELKRWLAQTGKISSSDVDLYIAFQDKDHQLTYYEVLCNRRNQESVRKLSQLASGSCSEQDKNIISQQIIYRFLEQCENDPLFRRYVQSGYSSIYHKFLSYFPYGNIDTTAFSMLHSKDGGWVFHSYPLLRNMVEAQANYELLSLRYRDVLQAANMLRENRKALRDSAREVLKSKTNKNSDPAQMNFFSLLSQGEMHTVPRAPHKLSKQKPKIVVPDDQGVSFDAKRKYVLDTINSLPSNVFYFSGNHYAKFNPEFFSCDISEEDLRSLNGYLDTATRRHIAFYTMLNARYHENQKNGYYSSTLDSEMSDVWHTITKRLKNSNYLNGAYAWAKLYNRYVEQDKLYREGVVSHGECYTKRK